MSGSHAMPTAEPRATTWTGAKASLSIFAISVGISLFTAAYEKSVNPLFGSVATVKYLRYVVHASTILAVILPMSRLLLLPCIAILVQVAPHTSYWVSVFAARSGNPVLGPLVTHATILAPVIYLAVSLAVSIDPTLAALTLVANALQLHPLILLVARHFSLDTHKDAMFYTLATLALFVWTAQMPGASRMSTKAVSTWNALCITKKYWPMLIPVTFFIFPALWSPTRLSSPTFLYQKNQDYPLRILSSKDSVTGVVVVGELLLPQAEVANPTTTHSIRYLRVSHSLLGGVWIGSDVTSLDDFPPHTDEAGTPLGDSIYNTFVLQEAARLVNHNLQGDAKGPENALIIGLGVGTSADAFVRHGISTTIVEIDPAVYDAARKYFGLAYPGDGRVFLEDARNWVYNRRVAMQSDESKDLSTFDIVIHDCFSEGIPQHLFSVEFWNDLKSIMKPDGVVAVNFAGKFGSQPTQAVTTTLLRVFGRCRVFHDLSNPISENQFYPDFLNMIYFCSPSSHPLTFRPAVDADYLHSYLRRDVLSNLDKREISISQLRGDEVWSKDTEEKFVLTDINNTLNAWQSEEALERWKLMRKMFPNILWESY